MRFDLKLLFVLVVVCAVTIEASTKMGLTPFGYRPKSCIYHASKINENTAACPVPYVKPMTIPEGWLAYAVAPFTAETEVTSYNGTWTVPPEPQDKGTQTLFLFTGLQNSYSSSEAVVSIIQPVLQWGPSEAGGGNYWSLASWYVDSNGNAAYSSLTKTAAGNNITGLMNRNGNESWVISSIDTTQNINTTLTHNVKQKELFAFVTLEVYSVSKCLEFPTANVSFQNLLLSSLSKPIVPTWTPTVEKACKDAVTVISNTSVTVSF